MIDDELLQRAKWGDREALDEVCRLEWRPIYGVLYHAVQNRTEAEDLTQEVFLRALRSLDQYQITTSPFHAYLVTIARNLLRDRWRRKAHPVVELESIWHLPSSDPGPEQHVLVDLSNDEISAALAMLPDEYQNVIRLRVIDARPSKEVAVLMGRNADDVRQLQRRALIALRAALRKESLA